MKKIILTVAVVTMAILLVHYIISPYHTCMRGQKAMKLSNGQEWNESTKNASRFYCNLMSNKSLFYYLLSR